jgi:hypothetical protein
MEENEKCIFIRSNKNHKFCNKKIVTENYYNVFESIHNICAQLKKLYNERKVAFEALIFCLCSGFVTDLMSRCYKSLKNYLYTLSQTEIFVF